MTPHKCPCCDGYGQRLAFGMQAWWGVCAPPMEFCVACRGAGVLWRYASPPAARPEVSPFSPRFTYEFLPSAASTPLPFGTVLCTEAP